MPDPSVERFRRVVASAYGYLEARREEVNDLNVFPVADGDTGDNMALTMRAVLAELDRIAAEGGSSPDRTEIVHAVARAALMGARGNSGVILSQIVRGAAEELATRPGELVDPVLIAAAFSRAADAAYASVRDPAEGTMLTVIREIAHAASTNLARLSDEQRRLTIGDLDGDGQDQVLAAVLETLIAAGERAVGRTTGQLEVLSEAGVVDAGAHGLVLILAGALAGLRGTETPPIEVPTQTPARVSLPQHRDSRYRFCVNFIVTGQGLDPSDWVPRLAPHGDSILVVGDAQTLKVHVHTDDPAAARELFDGHGEVSNVDEADMREQIAARAERIANGAELTGVLAVSTGAGMRRLFEELGADVVDGGPTMNPSTDELLAGIHSVPAPGVIVLPNSPNVVLAAERAAALSDRHTVVATATSQQAGLVAMVEIDPAAPIEENAERVDEVVGEVRVGAVAAAARDDVEGRFMRGDAVGFVDGEVVSWGGAGSTLAETLGKLSADAEILTIIEGEHPPIELTEVSSLAPDGIEVEAHHGGQSAYWWLLAAQ